MTDLDIHTYWERRLSEQYSLGGVGYLGIDERFNAWMYRIRRRVFSREVRRAFGLRNDVSVLDIGSGTGFYLDCWHELGFARVTGSDLTEVAVTNLRQRNPSDRIVPFDVGDAHHPFGDERFGAVSMMDVVFHIVDDERFERAFTTAFDLLEPGGVLFFTENFLKSTTIRLPHQVSRPMREVTRAVTDAGLEIVRRTPVFCLMNAPLDSDSRVLRRSWRVVQGAASRRPWAADAVGALLYPVELALVSMLSEGPSTELMVCRRPLNARRR